MAKSRTKGSAPAAARNNPIEHRNLYLWCLHPDAVLEAAEGAVAACHVVAGDLLRMSNGARIPVLRVLHVEALSHPEREARLSWPLHIAAGAVAHGSPEADLTVAAGTFCFIDSNDNIPTPISELVNGATVQRMGPELQAWCGIVVQLGASGPAESETIALTANGLALAGQRLETANAAEATLLSLATPHMAPIEPPFDLPSLACHALRRRQLADHALVLGYPQVADPDLRLLIGKHEVMPDCENAMCQFHLPLPELLRARGRVVLQSRQGAAPKFRGQNDERRLGVAVAQILADGQDIPLTHWSLGQGWHNAEAGWRWTNGNAVFLVPPHTQILKIKIANTLPAYPLPQRMILPVIAAAYT